MSNVCHVLRLTRQYRFSDAKRTAHDFTQLYCHSNGRIILCYSRYSENDLRDMLLVSFVSSWLGMRTDGELE